MKQFIHFWLKPGVFLLLLGVMLQVAASGLTAQAAAPTPPTAPVAGDAAVLPSNYVISVDSEMKALFTLNTSTNQVYGPFLFKQLGDITPYQYALRDIVITPDGKTALISSISDEAIYFVDVSDPTHLTYITSVPTAFIPEGSTEPVSIQPNDITLSSDGRYALITSSSGTTQVVTIDVEKREVASMTSFILQDGSTGNDFSPVFNAIEYAPDGTVIAPGSSLTTMLLQDDGSLAFGTLTQVFIDPYGGVHDAPGTDTKAPSIKNIFLAPDGKTVLAPDSISLESRLASPPAPKAGVPSHYSVLIYTITAPGQLEYQGVVTLTRAIQSITYNDNGTQAYAVGNNGIAIISDFVNWDNRISDYEYIELDSVSVLNINAPGNVTVEKENAVTLYQLSSGQHFGVDVVAYSRGKLIVGNPSTSNQFGSNLNVFRVVDLSNYETTWLPTGGGPLLGTRVLPLQKRLFLPQILLGSAAP